MESSAPPSNAGPLSGSKYRYANIFSCDTSAMTTNLRDSSVPPRTRDPRPRSVLQNHLCGSHGAVFKHAAGCMSSSGTGSHAGRRHSFAKRTSGRAVADDAQTSKPIAAVFPIHIVAGRKQRFRLRNHRSATCACGGVAYAVTRQAAVRSVLFGAEVGLEIVTPASSTGDLAGRILDAVFNVQ